MPTGSFTLLYAIEDSSSGVFCEMIVQLSRFWKYGKIAIPVNDHQYAVQDLCLVRK